MRIAVAPTAVTAKSPVRNLCPVVPVERTAPRGPTSYHMFEVHSRIKLPNFIYIASPTMRKGVGLGALDRRQLKSQQYASHGEALRSEQLSSLNTQLSVFQSLLQQFSVTHAKDIRSNPTFRAEFARMCTAIGVDPLASSSGKKEGNFWAQMLGGSVNDFYFELAVRIVEVCRATREVNGGLISVDECKMRFAAGSGSGGGVDVSEYVVHLLPRSAWQTPADKPKTVVTTYYERSSR